MCIRDRDSRVGIQVSDATGNPVPIAQLKKGTESVNVTLNGDVTSTAGIGTGTTEQFDAANNQNSKTVIDSMDDSISGGIVLGETMSGRADIFSIQVFMEVYLLSFSIFC